MRRILAATAALLVTIGAQAAEIKALITTAMNEAVIVLVPQFEKATGHKVTVSYDPSGGLARRLRGGEFADMILVASPELDKLIADATQRRPVAASPRCICFGPSRSSASRTRSRPRPGSPPAGRTAASRR